MKVCIEDGCGTNLYSISGDPLTQLHFLLTFLLCVIAIIQQSLNAIN